MLSISIGLGNLIAKGMVDLAVANFSFSWLLAFGRYGVPNLLKFRWRIFF